MRFAIPALPTQYRGITFRSRLEARWAFFFDLQAVWWRYEHRAFNFDGLCYLPDFYLPRQDCWAEVKPRQASPEEWVKLKLLALETKSPCMLLAGLPAAKPFRLVEYIPPAERHEFEDWWPPVDSFGLRESWIFPTLNGDLREMRRSARAAKHFQFS